MTTSVIAVFQSGAPVHTSGIYRVIGVDPSRERYRQEPARRELWQGDCFPNYEGRMVCWLLVEITIEQVVQNLSRW